MGKLRQIAKMQLLHGPTYTHPTRAVMSMDSSDQMLLPIKSASGGYLLQAAFEGRLVEDINERAS